MSHSYTFFIHGISCVSCCNTLETALRANLHDAFQSVYVDLTMSNPKKVTITINKQSPTHPERKHQLAQLIEKAGFHCEKEQATEKEALPHTSSWFQKAYDSLKSTMQSHWFLGAVGLTLGIGVLIICLVFPHLSLAAMAAVGATSTLFTLLLGTNSYMDAWNKLTKSKTLTMDSLFSISTLASLAVSVSAFFIPWLPMMFEAGLLIYGFRHIGLAIEETLKQKITPKLFQDRTPKKVIHITPDGKQEVELKSIQAHDVIEIQGGMLIPLDGFCLKETLVYDTIITGRTIARSYKKQERLLAGMRLAENEPPIELHVQKNKDASYLSRLDETISKALIEKAPLEIKYKTLLAYFIPAILGLAILSGLIVGFFFPAALAIQCAVSVLISACPCTLGLIVPLAVKVGMHKASESGMHFKSAEILQQAEQIDHVVFDLNGTLTTGVPQVKKMVIVQSDTISQDEFLQICASLENTTTNSIGKAVYAFAKANGVKDFHNTTPIKSQHNGVIQTVNGKEFAIGNQTLMQQLKINTQGINQSILQAGDSIVFVAKEQLLWGYFIMEDRLRKGAKLAVDSLKEMGKTIHLCTGADEQTAMRYAKALGIQHVQANCVAASLNENDNAKPHYIQLLKQKGHKVAMIGDAGNDAAALTTSNLGVAILSQNSDELTQEHAGVVVKNRSLQSLASIFTVSSQTMRNIKQNLAFSFGYNIAAILLSGGLLLSIGLTLTPGVGAALMAIQACLILLNVYSFAQKPLAQNSTKTNMTEHTKHQVPSRANNQCSLSAQNSPLPPEQNINLCCDSSKKNTSRSPSHRKDVGVTQRTQRATTFWKPDAADKTRSIVAQEEPLSLGLR